MLLIDVHAHLDAQQFEHDVADVVQRAKVAGLVYALNNGLTPVSNRATLALAKQYPLIKPALGLYPTMNLDLTKQEIAAELSFIRKSKPYCIGEIGLDYMDASRKSEQQTLFKQMLDLAEELHLPVCIHSRKAEEDCIEMLAASKLKKVILHCFTGKLALAKKAINLGFSFSIPPNIVHSSQFQELVKIVPLSQLLTETDSPYLGPVKGERNEPKNVLFAVQKIADIKAMEAEEVAKIIFMNGQRMFG
ncbi:TatD family hydrolase [Candidatus Woesearchaeota archaeon]|nr:TatD family hydrolase [Candidatus Woesearchaeota archaeon]